MFRSACRVLSIVALVLGALAWPTLPASHADPLPADYSGTTHGDVLALDLAVVGGAEVTASLAHSATATDSTADPRAQAESSNLHVGAVGISVGISDEIATADNVTPTDSYDTGLGEVDVPGVLDTGLITGTGSTTWAGDAACVPDGAPISQSTTSVAGVDLGLTLLGLGLDILHLDTIETAGGTTLQGGSVVSTTEGNLAGLSLLNELVQVQVLANPVLTATSAGGTGSVSANDYEISVSIAGQDAVTLTAGMSIPIELEIAGLLETHLVLGVGTVTDSSGGATGSGAMTFLSLSGTINALPLVGDGAELAELDLGLVPISAEATGPTTGVECTVLDAPVITSPTAGEVTGETPTISGTGTPGATVTVNDTDGSVIGTAVVQPDGTWSLVPDAPLAVGEHTITATQATDTAASGPSASVTFTVADQTPPDAPRIESPADGSTTADNTPTVSGTGEPGATVEVVIDGVVVGTTPVNPDGTWSIDTTDPLADGPHTVEATQTDPAGNTSPTGTSTFVVDTTAPVVAITSPTDGEVANDATPTITGTVDDPTATVDVVITDDTGTVVFEGPATVDPTTGEWTVDSSELLDGDHAVEATASDPAGNTSTDSVDFIVDTAAPVVAITSPTDGEVTNDATPTITGTVDDPTATVDVVITDEAGTVVFSGPATVDPTTGAWTVDSTELLDGDHTVEATATDPAGNTSTDAHDFIVDTTVPEAPVIASPAEGSTTGPLPIVSGTGEPGATVEVSIDDTVIGTATVADDGTWTVPTTSVLADGEHVVSATQTDPAGNPSPADNNTFIVDGTAPDAPVIESPADGTSTNDTTPTISGTGEPGATVEVTIDGTAIGTTTVADDGTWALDTTDPLAEGEHTVSASQTDATGNTSVADSNTFTIDTTPPAAPVITAPAEGSVTSDTTPPISGTGDPGATVEVTIDGTVIGTTEVAGDGTWSITPAEPLADGEHTLTATQTDPAGNTSPVSDPDTFAVDTTAPDAPVIESPADGSVTSDNTPTVTGTAEPGTTVKVTIDGTVVGTTTADDTGAWTLDLLDPLADGDHVVGATATDEAGNASPATSHTFTVDTTTPDAPVIDEPAGPTADTTPTITGTGEPGATVEVTIDGTVVGETTVQPDGTWTLDPTDPLTDGDHTVTATQTDEAGNTSPTSNEVTITIDTTAPDAPVIDTPADGSTTADPTPTVTGTAEPGSTVEVTIDGAVVGTSTADDNGDWTLELTDALTDGDHVIEATATDEAGNTGPTSDPVTVTVDTTAPDAPVITAPADGSTTGDATPAITGTGEPGATVEITIDGEVVGTTTVGIDGTWSFTPSTPLADGEHTVSATQADAAGNTSAASPVTTFTVDTTADVPVIDAPTSGTVTNDNTPTVSGIGEPGATVTVTADDGTVLGTAVVADDGTWTFDSVGLADGTYTIAATQTDAAGNVSADSSSVIFTVDTVAEPPIVTGPADGDLLSDATPPISGTAEPGATVEVIIDGVVVGETTADETGAWTLEPTEPLAEGDHTIEAIQTDPAGNTSPASDPITITVDTVAPDAPVITGPEDGGVIDDTTPVVEGTGEPGSTIEIIVDGEVIGETTVADDGTWTFPIEEPLDDGEHAIEATATDEAGNTSPASDPVTFTVDTVAAPPTITGPTDGSTTTDRTPPITGTGEPGATVTITLDGEELGETVVGDDGTWSFILDDSLSMSEHTIEAVQTDELGNVSEPTSSTFTVAPLPPVITSPQPDDEVDSDTTVSGTGIPGATVDVQVDGETVGATTIGDDGEWSVGVPDVSCGDHTITATQTVNPTSEPSEAIDVTVACPSGTGGTGGLGGALPDAGSPAGLGLIALLGLLAVVAGGYLVRRRRGA